MISINGENGFKYGTAVGFRVEQGNLHSIYFVDIEGKPTNAEEISKNALKAFVDSWG
jgi:hypothetical protein